MNIVKHKKVIAVVGASRGCGATFVAANLSVAMAKSAEGVTFLEDNSCGCPRCRREPLVYYEKELFKNIPSRRFVDFFFEKATGCRIDNRVNYFLGVNWVVRTPESPICSIKPVDIGGRYIIWDNPVDFSRADIIICVISPQRAHIMAGLDLIRYCQRNCRNRTVFLFNQVTSAAAMKRTEKLIGTKGDYCIPVQDQMCDAVFEELAEHILTLF